MSEDIKDTLKDISDRLAKLEHIIYGPDENDDDYLLGRKNAYKQIVKRLKDLEVASSSRFYKK